MAKDKKTTEDMESVGYGYGEAEEEDEKKKKKKEASAVVYAGKKKPLKGKDRKAAAKRLLGKINKK